KIDRPVLLDNYIDSEFEKTDHLKQSYLNGLIEDDELTARVEIVFDRVQDIFRINMEDKIYRPYHYIVLLDTSLEQLSEVTETLAEQLGQGELPVNILGDKELAVFLKYNFTADFDEREVNQITPDQYMDWILPERIEFTGRSIKYDNLITNNLRVIGYPTTVGNAWGHRLFNIPDTKVVMKLTPVDREKAIRNIDRSIDELRGQEQSTGKASRLIELSGHIDTLAELLTLLQNDNEALYDVTLTVTVMDYEQSRLGDRRGSLISAKKRVKRLLAEESFRTNDMFLQQFEAHCCTLIGAANPLKRKAHAIHSTSVAAAFPFVYSNLMDDGGVNIGNSSGTPVFINFFKRDRERVNSNMVIIGKSGGGKSFATKTILTHLAAEDSKIFILDPENEYAQLAKSLNGKQIDVGTATQGRMNPFHIITSLTDEEGDTDEASTGFSAHLQFLEEFFKQILPGIPSETLEFLNNLLVRTYADKRIDQYSDFANLGPEDFPTFDDLYDKILTEYQKFQSDYNKNILRSLLNYVSKFSMGGRNSNLWNGSSTISTKENFIVFNFQSLLSNKNTTIANAQMLLVLKWLDNEIIKNRDYNMKYAANRKVIIVIDEAHAFIDEKFPVALDFMHQLAKRIRKYNGMQIVITQNIKDFVGTEEIARKSTAIINACQYSMIFPLSPNDMHDLCRLYEKAGAINETEQEEIINNGRGRAFLITSPSSRTSVNIVATEPMQKMFQ
ncbi:MAG: ATP-binding protein, partial [Oscillospiraceae bacterium]|nr:ATP-binding protein [Oscillospiraceae bacterium]